MNQEIIKMAELVKSIPLSLFFLPKNLFFRRAFGIAPMDCFFLYQAIDLQAVKQLPLFRSYVPKDERAQLVNQLAFPHWERLPGLPNHWFVFVSSIGIPITVSYVEDHLEFKTYPKTQFHYFLDNCQSMIHAAVYVSPQLTDETGDFVISILKDLSLWQ